MHGTTRYLMIKELPTDTYPNLNDTINRTIGVGSVCEIRGNNIRLNVTRSVTLTEYEQMTCFKKLPED